MEPDSKLPSDDNVPSFFSNDDKNTEESSHAKNDKTNSFEQPLKKSQRTSNQILHWPSLGIGAGIAIACIFAVFFYCTFVKLGRCKHDQHRIYTGFR